MLHYLVVLLNFIHFKAVSLIDLPATESIASKANPLTLYLARLAPSSQLTMRYVLQDAADRLDSVSYTHLTLPTKA